MAEKKSRPVPKRRSVYTEASRNDDYSTTDLYGTVQEPKTNTRASEVPGTGLPTCLQLRIIQISPDQKSRDSTLPRLLYELDEACKKYSNDAEKSRLANSCMQAASSPKRKYRILDYFELLGNNKNDIQRLAGALSILEKYSMNLLREEKPPQWKEIKFSTSIIHEMVFPVKGALDVLKQMGYTEETKNTITFPHNVDHPNIQTVVVLTADLSIARHETDALIKNVHPFLMFNPSGFDASNSGDSMSEGGFCGVCSEQNLAKSCHECDMQFCLECDERWHNHKLRRNHVRNSLLAVKDQAFGEKKPRPVPVPRQRRGQNTGDGNLRNSQNFQDFSVGKEERRRSSSGNYAPSNNPYSSGDQEIKRPPSRTGTSRDNMTSSGNTISPQHRMNPLYGVHPQTGSPYSGSDQSERSPQDFHQLENRTQGFDQSGSRGQDFHQSRYGTPRQGQHKPLHRLLSCPDCASLYSEDEERCPSCGAATEQIPGAKFSPNQHTLNTAATKLPRSNFPSGISNSQQNRPLKDIATRNELVSRPLPDPPRGQGQPARDDKMNVDDDMYEDVDNILEWNCEHCTFANPPSTKVCQACYKTPSDLKKKPKLVEKSPSSVAAPNLPVTKPSGAQGTSKTPDDHGAIYMTPKNRPLDGGIYRSATGAGSPPLPTKKSDSVEYSPGGRILDAQKDREQQLTEKERGKLFDEEKQELCRKRLITEDESYSIQSREVLDKLVEARKMTLGYQTHGYPGQAGHATPGYSGQAGYPTAGYPGPPAYSTFGPGQAGYSAASPGEDLNPQQLQQLIKAGVLTGQDIINDQKAQKDFDKDRQGAQKDREQQLTEKEKAKLFDEEKQELCRKGLITKEEIYSIQNQQYLNELVEARKRMTQGYSKSGYPGQAGYSTARYPGPPAYSAFGPGQAGYSAASPGEDLNPQQLQQLIKEGVLTEQDIINDQKAQKDFDKDRQVQSDVPRGNVTVDNRDDLSLSDEQLQQLLTEGGFFGDVNPGQPQHYGNLPNQSPQQFTPASPGLWQHNQPNIGNQQSQPFGLTSELTDGERQALYEAGLFPDPRQGIPTHGHSPVNEADIQGMLAEFKRLDPNSPASEQRHHYDKDFNYYNYNVTREAPQVHGIYDKLPSTMYASMPAKSSKNNFSSYLNSQKPLDNLTRKHFIDDQSKLYVKWLKEAEQLGFTVEELNLANHLNWQDQERRNPVQWLKDEWSDRVAEVIGRVTEKTSNENDRIGNLSTDEAKKGLLENNGSVESACKACIESRREKLAKMSESSFFTRVDCLNALDRNKGNLEQAMLELEVKALEPIRRRVLGLHDLEDSGVRSGRFDNAFEEVVKNQNVSFERRVRIVFAERKIRSWGRAETTVRLVDMGYKLEDCIEAADAFGFINDALAYLQQECPICFEQKPMGQMLTFLCCQDKICKDCVKDHLTVCIKEMQIHRIVCPVCGLPDLRDETEAALYFNNLDIMIRVLVDAETHDLFQKKLRDRALRKEENFRWCAHCSYGFINDNPNVNKMQCPGCQTFTCFSCRKPWEDQHEGITCEEFARWKEENDEEYQLAGLAGHLARNGIDCPECRFRYDLARGGCMHFKCGQCGHEFCSGCNNPFKHGAACDFSAYCARRGIHAHHPRDCLFFLRDWDTVRLQQLLRENNVNYQAGVRGLPVQDNEEILGAVGGEAQVCEVMLQKEQGMDDVKCGIPCQPGHDGLCEKHYKEYLVDLINKSGIDPADRMEIDEIHVVFRRAEMEPPARGGVETDDVYRQRLLEVLKQQIPLPRPPGIEADADDALGEVEE